MKFWQKTYIFTLVLFLLCMNIGILSLTVYTYGKNVESVETSVKAEQHYIEMNLERDFADMTAKTDGSDVYSLMRSFGIYYGNKGIYLAFYMDGERIYSKFDEKPDVGLNQLMHTDISGKRHIVISTDVCEGRYEMIFAKDVSSLDGEFRSLLIVYTSTALGVSVLLAVVLYFILKKLSGPLEMLRKTTEAVESGDYTVTAKETGNDEFTLLARSFNSMIAKVNEQMTALELDAEKKQILVDNLAHELRTPLTSIHGYAEYLEKASSSEENRILASRYIISEADRLQKISEILLDSAYIRGNPPDMTELDAAEIMHDVACRLKMKADGAGVELICDADTLPTVGSETLLSMLFYNLTENAIKACAEGDKVRLYCDGMTAVVEDSGKGMTPSELEHITEPFYRTDKSRSRAEGGAGLGLALSKQIAETHGANLVFESEYGIGTKASVYFTSLKQD